LRQSQRQPAILEGESPEDLQKTRASATGCPGVAASSPIPLLTLWSRERERAAGWRRGCGFVIARSLGREIVGSKDRSISKSFDLKIMNRQLALANAALLARESGSVVGLKRSSAAMR